MLQVSGLLNPAMYGPQLPLKRAADNQWVEDDKKDSPNRRSIYLSYGRTRPEGFLRTFDCPDMTSDSQSQRFRSALPSQSLALLNNPLVRRVSQAFAAQVLEQAKGDREAALRLAFQAAYSREPQPEELAIAHGTQDLRLFLQAVLGANEFLYSF